VREIPLTTQGKIALVDDEDYDWLNQVGWYAYVDGKTFYAARWVLSATTKTGRTVLRMHRAIMGLTDPKVQVDHEDGNGLNNQRYNMRVATPVQNGSNRRTGSNNTSGYKGVNWCGDRWRSRICVAGNRIELGYFDDPTEAATAYDEAALIHHGPFARLNLPKGANA
jgi:hypothetical protein